MTTDAQRQIADLPILEELGHEDFGADFSWVTEDLFKRPHQGLMRAPWGDDVVAYRNCDIGVLRRHKESAHQHLEEQTRPLMVDGLVPQSIMDFWTYGTFAVRPPEHTPRKQLILKVLTAQSVARFRDDFVKIIREQIDDALDKGRLDFLEEFAKPLVARFWSHAFNMPFEEAEYVLRLTEQMTGIIVLSPTTDQVRASEEAMKEFTRVLPEAMERAARNGGSPLVDDLVSLYAQIPEDTPGRPVNPFKTLTYPLLDGFNTFASMIASLVYALDEGGVDLQVGRDDPDTFASNAFQECTRLHSPVTITVRQAAKDFVHDGVLIPRDTNMVMIWLFGNRDPEAFPDPMRFELERPNRVRQYTFGGGPYACAGRNVATVWCEILLAELVKSHVNITVSGPAPWKPGSTLHELASLPVTISRN
jgi:cytochrome P450